MDDMKYHELTPKQQLAIQAFENVLHTLKGSNDIYSPSIGTFYEEYFDDLRDVTDYDHGFLGKLEYIVWEMILLVRANT
jgi:hypothetical protein